MSWFVGNSREMKWWDRGPHGFDNAQVGVNLFVLAPGARDKQDGPDWGAYPYSEVAMNHDASAEEETTDPAYARFPDRQAGAFQEGWLP